MATLLQMRDRVRNTIRDSDKLYVTDAMLTEWLNEAYLDLNARLGVLRKAATPASTSATGTVSLPADFVKIEYFEVEDPDDSTRGLQPEFTHDEVFTSYRRADVTPGKTLARIFGGVIETYPQVVSKPYVLEYVYKPTPLSADGDIPVLPEETHVRLINYARAHARWMSSEMAEGDRYMQLYEAGLPGAPTATLREKTEITSFIPEPGYWDTEV